MSQYFKRFVMGGHLRLILIALLLSTMIGLATGREARAYSFDPNSYTTPIAFRCYPVTQWMQTGSHVSGGNRYAIDIGTPSGTQVYATKSGTVVWAGWEGAGGIVIRVNHGDGLQSVFAHLSGVNVRVGQWVNKDYSLLGWTGATGYVTGPHLHWHLQVQGSNQGIDISRIPGVSRWQICP